ETRRPETISMSFDPDQLPSRPELFDFRGVSMTHFFTDNWENVQNFKARPDDVLIATYPKAGTTWVSYILDLLYFGQTSPERQTSVPIYERVPFLELIVPKFHHKLHFNTTFSPQDTMWRFSNNMVSYFHFDSMAMIEPDPGDWNNYFQRFMQGKVVTGSWYDHVNGWWKKKQTSPNVHYMFYEDLVEDTGREIDKLCSFLGLSPSEDERKRITGGVQFDKMKKNNMTNYSTHARMDFKTGSFMRKGRVGDWKNHFTVAQNEEFDEDYKKKMKDPTLQLRTDL
uniref:Sulfotransferase n=1 Tax=Anabas testudineus TaxID=64144 RepID=A0A3Q1IHA7_ANATE